MNTDRSQIEVGGLPVQIVRKAIKNLHLGVYPPHGRVRVAAPLRVTDEAVRLAVIGKLGWIKRQRARFEGQSRESQRELVSGESHFYLGRRYRLRVIHKSGKSGVVLHNRTRMELHAQPKATAAQRDWVLQRWYRQELKKLIPPLLEKWQAVLGVHVTDWGIKKMKTKWGACNVDAKRVWLNLELAKKPTHCLEYLVLHELMHFRERHHNDRFVSMMDRHLPNWRSYRQELNAAPLTHNTWTY
jgi:predicted metal-dependent hydrolase